MLYFTYLDPLIYHHWTERYFVLTFWCWFMVYRKLCLQSCVLLQTFIIIHNQDITVCCTKVTVMSSVSLVALLVLWMTESFVLQRHCSRSCPYICAMSVGNVGWGNRHLDMGHVRQTARHGACATDCKTWGMCDRLQDMGHVWQSATAFEVGRFDLLFVAYNWPTN
jgi:hypothetical protein